MKVLITGGLGFIGSHLTQKLVQENHNVTVLTKTKNKINNIKTVKNKINIIVKDIKNIGEEVSNFDVIFHLASTTDNYAIVENDLERDIETNCKGTLYLLHACKEYNPSVKIIFGSSFFVIGNPELIPVNESASCDPLSLYPATKLCAEHICKIYFRVFDLDIVIARFANVYGPREKGRDKKKAAFNYMINQAVNDNELTLYDKGDFVRDYIYVEDVVSALTIIMEKAMGGEIYHIGSGKGIKIKNLFEMTVDIVDSGQIVEIQTPKFHKNVGIRDFIFDISKIRSLGWEPKFSIREGIKRTAEYYKKQV